MMPPVIEYMLVCPLPFGAAERGREPNNATGSRMCVGICAGALDSQNELVLYQEFDG